jgi:hypothetical protein
MGAQHIVSEKYFLPTSYYERSTCSSLNRRIAFRRVVADSASGFIYISLAGLVLGLRSGNRGRFRLALCSPACGIVTVAMVHYAGIAGALILRNPFLHARQQNGGITR